MTVIVTNSSPGLPFHMQKWTGITKIESKGSYLILYRGKTKVYQVGYGVNIRLEVIG